MDKKQEDWLWKEDKVGTGKGHRSRLKRSEQREKKMNLSAGSCVQMTQPRSPAQGTKQRFLQSSHKRTDVWTRAVTRPAPQTFSKLNRQVPV